MKTIAVLIAALALASAASDGDEIEFWPIPTIPEAQALASAARDGDEIEYWPEPEAAALNIVPEVALASAASDGDEIEFWPIPTIPEAAAALNIVPGVRPLPFPLPVVPELRPPVEVEEENVVAPELRPLPVEEDPCSACFAYMSSLIDQLSETVAVEPNLPSGPHQIDPETEIRPLPSPVAPEISIFPSFPTF